MRENHYILIIDDNPLAIKLFTNYLSDIQYNCFSARNGREALEILTKYSFSLIICDINMPIMNGFEFIKEFRKSPEYSLIPILVISSDDKEENVVAILQAGADDFISKPINEQIFVSKVASLISNKSVKSNSINNLAVGLFADNTKIIYCIEKGSNYLPLFTEVESKYVDSAFELNNTITNEKVSLICVDEHAEWFFYNKQKIINVASQTTPIVYFVSEGNSMYNENSEEFLFYKHFPVNYIKSQLHKLIQTNKIAKEEYIQTLKKAFVQSTFILDEKKIITNDIFNIEIFHSNFNEIPGGDYYEHFYINEQYSIVLLGDIMGKLWNAWLYLPVYLAYIRSSIKFIISRNLHNIYSKPEKILYLLNELCAKDMHLSEVFSTLSIVIVDNKDKKLYVAGAGSISPLIYNNNKVKEINIVGSLLGIQSNSTYNSIEIEISKNDMFLIYTDGYIEVGMKNTESYLGKDNFISIFAEYCTNKRDESFDQFFQNQKLTNSFNDDRSYILVSLK